MRPALPAALLALLLTTAPTNAPADGQSGSFEIWGFESLATQSLGDWNTRHDQIATALDFIDEDWHGFGTAIPWGGELGYRLTRRVTLGIAASQQVAVAENGFDNPGVIVDERIAARLRQVVGVVGIEVPGTQGLFVWGRMGWGFGKVEEASRQRFSPPDDSLNSDFRGDYDGSGLVAGVNIGLRRELGGRAMVRLGVGYQSANLGELEGPQTFTSSSGTSAVSGPPRNPFTGAPISTDFSGFHLSAGVGIILNGVR
jgi:hypothetical protein